MSAVARGIERLLRFLRRLQGSLLFLPIILIIVLALFLMGVGQIKEILIRVVEWQNANCGTQLVLGFLSFAFLTVMLFFSYLSACVVLRKTGIGYGSSLVYGSETELKQDRRIIWIRDLVAIVCAALPIIAVGYTFWSTSDIVGVGRTLVDEAVSPIEFRSLQLCSANSADLAPQLARVAIGWTVLSVLLLIALFLFSRYELLRDRTFGLRRTRTQRHFWTLTFPALAALVSPIILINVVPSWYEELFNFLGPLATLGLVLASLSWLLFFIGEQSRRSGIPIFLIITSVVFILGLYLWMSTPGPNSPPQSAQAPSAGKEAKLQKDFEAWLKSRADLPAAGQQGTPRRPYPVYIVAAPGGGIYAASFLASVVSRIEQHCPGFTQHVFAISAVSGGAIGSSIINAVSRDASQARQTVCLDPVPPKDPQVLFVKAMLADDHLSPTMASTIPDLITKLGLIMTYEVGHAFTTHPPLFHLKGRAEALEESFTEAVGRACMQVVEGREKLPICNGERLSPFREDFNLHWRADGVAPALVLNTTWAETGQRIAFSPFPLTGVGDDTLTSMQELKGTSQESLIEAAVASARFPAMMPALIYNKEEEPRFWWNFVDGGYADASGTTTALELYRFLEQNQQSTKDNTGIDIDLKFLLLTESSAVSHIPSGAGLSHAISPITTLLTIRDQIGRRAVARARKDLPPVPIASNMLDCGRTGERWRMREILLDSSAIGLPLGWMLSRHTADMIDRIATMPDKVRYKDEDLHGKKVAEANKSAFRDIRQSLTGNCSESAGR
jgi:hypothetical protein